ncbi:MAG: hypothetical protein HFH68_08035 [Lachnospiraceae bacterium]|nr:hypothetical protein [Lachnospiraceae bacterium]
MDLSPVYELQERLRASIIAGANLINEDFRLKRAAEAIKPLAAASPVFAKLCQQTELLLSSGCGSTAGVLLDTMALADAIICTLGTVEVKSEITDIELTPDLQPEEDTQENPYIINAPYSQVKTLVNALTTTGSGNYNTVNDMLYTCPDIFKDYRVKHALVCALGASYSELASLAYRCLSQNGAEIIPLLKKDFDPNGKKEMVHRVNIISEISGAAENSFYIEMLETATGDVRTALINALRYEPSNFDRLVSMAKTERGKNKQCVLNILGSIENDTENGQLYGLFKQIIKKSPDSAIKALLPATTSYASKVIAETCIEQLTKVIKSIEKNDANEITKTLSPFCKLVMALPGKHGDEVCQCYKQLLKESKTLDKSGWKPALELLDYSLVHSIQYIYHGRTSLQFFNQKNFPPRTGRKLTWELIIGSYIAQSLVIFPDGQLKQMAMELFENSGNNTNFLTAATLVKMLESSNCSVWLDEQVKNDKNAMTEIQRALSYVRWDKKLNSYVTCMYFSNMEWQDSRKTILNKTDIPDAIRIQDWMMEQYSQAEGSHMVLTPTGVQKRDAEQDNLCMDEILNRWINTADLEQCKKAGSYFYNRALSVQDNADYLRYMLNCKWTECQGLATRFARNKKNIQMWEITDYLYCLPGDNGTIQKIHKEIDAVIELIKSGEVKMNYNINSEHIQNWFENLKNPSNYICLNPDRYEEL